MIKIDPDITPRSLLPKLEKLFDLAARKVELIKQNWGESQGGAPVYTVKGKYTARGWTEWTQGFQYGCAILQYDATGEENFLHYGRDQTIKLMAPHLTHTGVHDHGFNNVSTYGNLLRLMREGRIPESPGERNFYELALKISGAVQAARWTSLPNGLGYIPSFNGAQSLFSDTIRSLRALVLSHQLGHYLLGEQEQKINLLERALQHAETSARFNVYYGKNRDAYDISGRVVHESIFNVNSGSYRCPSTQQGYSPFSTWTRGHAWILSGFPEQLECLETLAESEFASIAQALFSGKSSIIQRFLEVSETVADFYLEHSPLDGIPYWDTGAPGLAKMGDYLNHPSDPFNAYEPVDSSAAAIAAQGLIRLGKYLIEHGSQKKGQTYLQAGLTTAGHLFSEPYLSEDPRHEGLLLHSVYHRPNNWDYIPEGHPIPFGESCMWGDYHAMELGILLWRMAKEQPYYKFYI
ncbi:MAG: glycoside hydrolase family 88 protein [SAR324 cluster bacterium]|nr:glycoside hydrolase family 88 protein [SAR324 cluster bacterium]